ncbi:MAG TPA: 2Fe-2S iron-sulfur cluster-binding protein [Pseudobdellovibrionaceae bacterium]|nr:2Fe-2S iron-sulfur cluster-binding protein [Pseudobdellovibrionaceae bacterium]
MKVKFVPQNVEVEIKPGQSVMHLAEDNGIYVKSVCRGVPSCAECRVRIVEGKENALRPTRDELNLIGSGWFLDQRRLSCQLQCIGDVTIDMSEQIAKSQGLVLGQKKRKALQNDRVEDEVVIRDPSASRSGGDASDADAGGDDESNANAGDRGRRGDRPRSADRGGRDARSQNGPRDRSSPAIHAGSHAGSSAGAQNSNSPRREGERPEGGGGGGRRRRRGGRGGGGRGGGGGGAGPSGGPSGGGPGAN